jgi:hypothetical protein
VVYSVSLTLKEWEPYLTEYLGRPAPVAGPGGCCRGAYACAPAAQAEPVQLNRYVPIVIFWPVVQLVSGLAM